MKLPSTRLDEYDFGSLPPALRRKYFSSLERLRLGQDGSLVPACSPHERPPRHSLGSKSTLRNATPCIDHPQYHLGKSSSRRLRKTRSMTASYLALQAEAEWFWSLPSKIQQTRFSREEQVLFAGTRDSVILDAADKLLLRLRQQVQQKNSDEVPGPESLGGTEMLDPAQTATADTPAVHSTRQMDDGLFSSFRWNDDEDDLDLSLDEYHAALADTVDSRPPPGKCKPSFRRHLSVGSIQFHRNSSASNKSSYPGHNPTAPTSQSPSHSRAELTFLPPRHKSHVSTSSIDPAAKHYRDPEARLKLRVYLASPQKFDEALEFGFPSIAKTNKPLPKRPGTSPRLTQDSDRTFFRDDLDSLFEDGASAKDDASVTDCNSPRTPPDHVLEPFRLSHASSLDNPGSKRPVIYRKLSEPHTHACAAKREMTLHMTLTRPDLRTTNGSVVAAPTDESLHITALPSAGEQQPIWDSLPAESSRVKRFWRRIRRT